jgi:hypothetical protein
MKQYSSHVRFSSLSSDDSSCSDEELACAFDLRVYALLSVAVFFLGSAACFGAGFSLSLSSSLSLSDDSKYFLNSPLYNTRYHRPDGCCCYVIAVYFCCADDFF